MSALDKIISDVNQRRAFFNEFSKGPKREMMSHPLTSDDVESLCCYIESSLSPENLHCDGEISPQAAAQKKRQLDGAYEELCNRYACVRMLYV